MAYCNHGKALPRTVLSTALLINTERESRSTPGRATITVNTLKYEERENNTPTWIIIIISWVQSGGLGWLEDLSLFTATAGASDLDCRTEEPLWCESTQLFRNCTIITIIIIKIITVIITMQVKETPSNEPWNEARPLDVLRVFKWSTFSHTNCIREHLSPCAANKTQRFQRQTEDCKKRSDGNKPPFDCMLNLLKCFIVFLIRKLDLMSSLNSIRLAW